MSSIIQVEKEITELEELRKQNKALKDIHLQFIDVGFLLDLSGSMNGMLPDGKRAIDHLKETVTKLRIPKHNYFGFANFCVQGEMELGIAGYSTNLAGAFQYLRASEYKFKKLVLISDGMPNSPELAIQEGKKLGIPVDIIYTGEKDTDGERFMEKLALETQGSSVTVMGTAAMIAEKIIHLLKEGEKK